MEKINGKWIHDGREYEVIDGSCSACPFKLSKEVCSLEHGCPIEVRKIFKLKEPKMKKEELKFKCILGSPARNEKMYDALAKAGLKNSIIKEDFVKSAICLRVGVFGGSEVSPTWAQKITESYEALDYPEVTYAEALELLKRVEPVAPEFDIKPFDRVLIKDMGTQWSANLFNKICNNNEFDLVSCQAKKMIKYESNEHFLGMYDMPAGWWECCEGKPVWRSK